MDCINDDRTGPSLPQVTISRVVNLLHYICILYLYSPRLLYIFIVSQGWLGRSIFTAHSTGDPPVPPSLYVGSVIVVSKDNNANATNFSTGNRITILVDLYFDQNRTGELIKY